MQVLEALQQAVVAAAERVGPAVVGLGRGWGRGSGVVYEPGLVLTCAHVLRGAEVAVTFGDGRTEQGRVAGTDADLDLAVVAVDTGGVTPVEWDPAAAGAVSLGAPVLALADPSGRGLRTTFGLVSATGRSFRGPGGRRIAGSIEHTAPLPRGSSGGPLVDTALAPARPQRRPPRGRPDPRPPRRRDAAHPRGRARARRVGRAPTVGRGARAGSPRAAHAQRGRAARARRAAGARDGRGQPGRARRAAAGRPARQRRRAAAARRRRALRRARRRRATSWCSASCAAPRSSSCASRSAPCSASLYFSS